MQHDNQVQVGSGGGMATSTAAPNHDADLMISQVAQECMVFSMPTSTHSCAPVPTASKRTPTPQKSAVAASPSIKPAGAKVTPKTSEKFKIASQSGAPAPAQDVSDQVATAPPLNTTLPARTVFDTSRMSGSDMAKDVDVPRAQVGLLLLALCIMLAACHQSLIGVSDAAACWQFLTTGFTVLSFVLVLCALCLAPFHHTAGHKGRPSLWLQQPCCPCTCVQAPGPGTHAFTYRVLRPQD